MSRRESSRVLWGWVAGIGLAAVLVTGTAWADEGVVSGHGEEPANATVADKGAAGEKERVQEGDTEREDHGGVGHPMVQWNIGATVGLTVRDPGKEARAHLGLRGDALFGRASPWDVGYGPYGEVLTTGDDVSLGVGGSVLLPVHDVLPVVCSVGMYGRRGGGDWNPGVTGQIFWGVRSFNYHGRYEMAVGVTLQGRVGLGTGAGNALVVALQLDGSLIAMPVVFAVNAFRGGGRD